MVGPANSESTSCQGLYTPICKQSSFHQISFHVCWEVNIKYKFQAVANWVFKFCYQAVISISDFLWKSDNITPFLFCKVCFLFMQEFLHPFLSASNPLLKMPLVALLRSACVTEVLVMLLSVHKLPWWDLRKRWFWWLPEDADLLLLENKVKKECLFLTSGGGFYFVLPWDLEI